MRLKEFAPSGDGGGSGDYFQALASAWYNGVFDTGSLQKGIKSQQDVEQLLQRGIIGSDGVTRKYGIDYNSTFDGVVISSDDYYEHSDYNDQGQEVDSRNGRPWGPNDYMEFGDEELDESLNEFAADDGDSGEDDALHKYARMWWAGDEATQMQIEAALAKMGWEIGEDEGSYDNGGVFVIRAGDINGDSYTSWAAEDLTEGLTEVDRRGFLKGMGAAAVAGAAGGAKAQSDDVDGRFWRKLFGICVLHIACKQPYQRTEATKGRVVEIPADVCQKTKQLIQQFVRTYPNGKNMLQGAYDNMYDSINQAESAVPFKGSVLNKAYFDKGWQQQILRDFESLIEFNESVNQGVSEGAPISGDGGAVDNFRQQMANNTELAYQKGMAEAKKKKKKKSSRSLGRYFFPGYGYYGSGESGEGGGDGGGGESKNRGMAEGSEDPFGPQGRFVGDTGPAQLTTTVPRVKLKIGDRVIYKPTEQRATIVGLSRDGTQARIDMPSPMGGRVFNCKVADLKAPGQGLIKEKSTSQAQFRTMAAAAHDPKFARKVGIKQSVAREFNQADRGQSYKSLPKKS